LRKAVGMQDVNVSFRLYQWSYHEGYSGQRLGVRRQCQVWKNEPFKAYRLRDAPTGLTFKNFTFCQHCIYVFYIYLGTNSDLCHLQRKLVFITEMKSVYSAVRTGSLNKVVCTSSLEG